MGAASSPPSGVALARADVAARAIFTPGQRPSAEAIFFALRPLCGNAAECEEAWDLVRLRIAELQAEADGLPVTPLNERAA